MFALFFSFALRSIVYLFTKSKKFIFLSQYEYAAEGATKKFIFLKQRSATKLLSPKEFSTQVDDPSSLRIAQGSCASS